MRRSLPKKLSLLILLVSSGLLVVVDAGGFASSQPVPKGLELTSLLTLIPGPSVVHNTAHPAKEEDMPRKAKTAASPYSVHPGVAMMQQWVETLKDKTGRSLQEWLALVKKDGPATEKERRDWLKKQHSLGANSAWWIAERSVGKGRGDGDPAAYLQHASQWVEAMFSGGKAGLRPVYEELLELGKALGPDVQICPCQTIVPFYREHVFAQVKPSTRTRSGRLIDTGGRAKGDRITHRIAISSLTDIDAEVQRWLKTAYDLAGG
jgi:hypothetical protein